MSATHRMNTGFFLFALLLVIGGAVENTSAAWVPWVLIAASGLFFFYAMSVFYFGVTKGDSHLQRQGIKGSAVVISAKQTSAVAQTGQFAFQAPFIWNYRLRVTIPGKAPYEATCAVARDDISAGSTVRVAVSRFNRRSVAILANPKI